MCHPRLPLCFPTHPPSDGGGPWVQEGAGGGGRAQAGRLCKSLWKDSVKSQTRSVPDPSSIHPEGGLSSKGRDMYCARILGVSGDHGSRGHPSPVHGGTASPPEALLAPKPLFHPTPQGLLASLTFSLSLPHTHTHTHSHTHTHQPHTTDRHTNTPIPPHEQTHYTHTQTHTTPHTIDTQTHSYHITNTPHTDTHTRTTTPHTTDRHTSLHHIASMLGCTQASRFVSSQVGSKLREQRNWVK